MRKDIQIVTCVECRVNEQRSENSALCQKCFDQILRDKIKNT